MKDFYSIDLEERTPCVRLYPEEIARVDLEYFGVRNALDLSDFNWKVFETADAAHAWLARYQKTLASLDNARICIKKNIPCMLYKRRFIVQSLMREKLFTQRHYKKNLSPGDLFNLHDQKYFLTVRLTKLSQVDRGAWRYDFELP